MSPAPDNHHAVKKVVLPSGKTIEIVYFADPDEAAEVRPAAPQTGLHVCPECACELVYPESWDEAGDAWELQLRCPNCEWHGQGVYEQPVVEQLDEHIDNGTQVLVRDLKQLMHANMQDEVERFIGALRAGHIWPMDF